jgi:hypothetical protein
MLPAIVIQGIIWIVSTLVSIALRPKPDKPQPKGLSEFEFPTADASRAIPVIFGSVKVTGPNVIWYGNLGQEPFQVGGQDYGYYYTLGLALAVCFGPVDSIDGLLFEDRSAGWSFLSGDANMRTYAFNNVMLFGPNTQGGGVKGNADCFLGTDAQPTSTYLQSTASVDWPGLPRLCYLVLHGGYKPQYGGVYLGTSTYVKPMAVLATRCPNQLGLPSGHHQMSVAGGFDSNPACMLYEILTDTTWGLGLPGSSIDTDSFVAAGETLFTEGLGLAMILEQATEASETMREILRHIDAGLSTDPSTGKLVLKLIRDDYDIGDLPVLDQSNVSELEFSRGSWSETFNVAKVTYTSRADGWTERIAQWQNLANLQVQGVTVATQVDYRGFSNAHAAGLAAARVAKATSYPFARLRLKVNRAAWALRSADVFKLNWPPLGITDMVCRVTRPASGELENGRMSLESIEDSFSVSGTAYTDPPGSQWGDPVAPPVVAAQEQLFELPYHISTATGRQLGALAARAAATLTGFQIWSDPAGGTAYTGTNGLGVWCPYGELTGSYPKNTSSLDATGFSVGNTIDIDALESVSPLAIFSGYNLAVIVHVSGGGGPNFDIEIIAWQTVGGTGATRQITNVLRGVLDTVPVDHPAGAKVFFFGSAPLSIVDPTGGYPVDSTVTAKLLPFTAVATLPIASAAQLSKTLLSRSLLPLPAGKVRVQGIEWPTSFAAGADRTVTWATRNRIFQKAAHDVVSQDAGNYPGGSEGDYTIEVRVAGVLKRTVTGIAGTSWTWTAAMQTTDGATAGTTAAIRLYSVNGSLVGWTYQERSFSIT